MISFCSFEGVRHIWVKLCIFFSFCSSCPLQPTNCCFVPLKAISDKDLQTILQPFMIYIELWWIVKNMQNNALKIQETRSTIDILTSDTYINFIFNPALIDNLNNVTINRLIRLVVTGMLLLYCSASLMSFSSF